jgi:NTE family protein
MANDAPHMDISEALRSTPLFAGLGRIGIGRLARQCELLRLPGGAVLYEQGAPADALYLLAHGRLRAERVSDGESVVLRELGRGETMGGLSLIAEMPHRARLRAVRDSEVIRIPPGIVERMFYRHPRFGREAVRTWLRNVLYSPPPKAGEDRRSVRTIAVVPVHHGASVEAVAQGLARALQTRGATARIDGHCVDAEGGRRLCQLSMDAADSIRYLDDLETEFRYVIYQTDTLSSEWAARCLRQADRVVAVASSGVPAQRTEMSELLRKHADGADVELVIVGDGVTDPLAWRELNGARLHHRVGVGRRSDFERLARLLTGRAVGVAFGGGGARGFAHIGLLQAMQELGLHADLIVGTSMGAMIGAMASLGNTPAEIREAAHDMFVARNVLNDYTVPRVSLIRARRARRELENLFGDRRIEDMPGYFACVTTNLSRARAEIHDQGRLAHWVGASMSVPGIAPPIVYRGDLLVDGGVLMPVPSDVLADLGRGPVLASDVSADETFRDSDDGSTHPAQAERARWGSAENINIFRILYRTATLSTPEALRARADRADCYMRMPVSGVGMFDWAVFDDAIRRGREHALRKLDAWLKTDPMSDPVLAAERAAHAAAGGE